MLASGDVHARGGPEAPLSRADILDKFREFASPVVGEGRADVLRDAVLGLARKEPLRRSRWLALRCARHAFDDMPP